MSFFGKNLWVKSLMISGQVFQIVDPLIWRLWSIFLLRGPSGRTRSPLVQLRVDLPSLTVFHLQKCSSPDRDIDNWWNNCKDVFFPSLYIFWYGFPGVRPCDHDHGNCCRVLQTMRSNFWLRGMDLGRTRQSEYWYKKKMLGERQLRLQCLNLFDWKAYGALPLSYYRYPPNISTVWNRKWHYILDDIVGNFRFNDELCGGLVQPPTNTKITDYTDWDIATIGSSCLMTGVGVPKTDKSITYIFSYICRNLKNLLTFQIFTILLVINSVIQQQSSKCMVDHCLV